MCFLRNFLEFNYYYIIINSPLLHQFSSLCLAPENTSQDPSQEAELLFSNKRQDPECRRHRTEEQRSCPPKQKQFVLGWRSSVLFELWPQHCKRWFLMKDHGIYKNENKLFIMGRNEVNISTCCIAGCTCVYCFMESTNWWNIERVVSLIEVNSHDSVLLK